MYDYDWLCMYVFADILHKRNTGPASGDGSEPGQGAWSLAARWVNSFQGT